MTKKDKLRKNLTTIIELYKSGYSLMQIGQKFNCSMELVRKVFIEKGIPIRNKKEQQALPIVKEKNRQAHLGKHFSPKTEFKKGNKPWNKKNVDENLLANEYNKGKSVYKLAEKFGLSRPTITRRLKKLGVKIRGGYNALIKWNKETPKEKKKNWKGGVAPLNALIREREEYQQWRRKILERDNYTCQLSGARGCELEVHHIGKTFAMIKKEAMKNLGIDSVTNENREDLIKEILGLNSLSKGITLSKEIHRKVHSGEIYIEGDIKRRKRREHNKKRIKLLAPA